MSTKYVKNESYVDDKGIFTPLQDYAPEGCASDYQMIMSKRGFIRAYVKFILIPNIKNDNKFKGVRFFNNITDEELENKLVESYMSGEFNSYNLFKLV